MTRRPTSLVVRGLAASVLLCLLAWPSLAEAHGRPQFAPRIGSQIDVGMVFVDSQGRRQRLEDALGGRPAVILTGYNRCENLCPVAQRELAGALADTGLAAADYTVLFISIDPREAAEEAADSKSKLAAEFGARKLAAWRFLTGGQPSVKSLLAQLGATATRRERMNDFAHPVAVMILTPDGRLARVLSGLPFEARDLRLALIEASAGRLGSFVDRVLLLCQTYDSTKGQYTPDILAALRIAGMVTLVALIGLVVLLTWRRAT